jgi:hypothetical protein
MTGWKMTEERWGVLGKRDVFVRAGDKELCVWSEAAIYEQS